MAISVSEGLIETDENEQDRLQELFWNRAALKKRHAKLQNDNDGLKERLKQQEGVTLRAKQDLELLETLLSDPQQAANALVFYQLRGIWNLCRRKLSRMATEMVSHQTDREQKSIRQRFEDSRQVVLDSLDGHIAKAKAQADALSLQLQDLHERLAKMRGFWNYFKRRRLRAEMSPVRVAFSDVSNQLDQLKASRKEKEAEEAPELSALSLKGQRRINLALIGIAQELYLHFSKRGISGLAREATVRTVRDANYGDVTECRELSNFIEQVVNGLNGSSKLVANVRNRAKFLESQASYRGEEDFLPDAGSFVSIPVQVPSSGSSAMGEEIAVNILTDEFWDIYTVLLK